MNSEGKRPRAIFIDVGETLLRPRRPYGDLLTEVPFTPSAYRGPSTPVATTHRNVVVGVTILAVLVLFNVWFWTGISVAGTVNPPEPSLLVGSVGESVITLDDYFSGGRVFIGLAVGIVGTVAPWMITDSVIGD